MGFYPVHSVRKNINGANNILQLVSISTNVV